MKPFFTIVIPVFNTQEYIARCLDSCVAQSFKDFEIIIVDDCGNDDSIRIAWQYAEHDARIHIYKNPENLGLFKCRISGDMQAQGQYIIYLDSDDFLDTGCLESVHKKILDYYNLTKDYIDIVHFDFTFFPNANQSKIPLSSFNECNDLNHKTKDCVDSYFISPKKFSWNIWGKAYKTSVIKNVNHFISSYLPYLKKFTSCEDTLKFFLITLFSRNNLIINQSFYNYAFSKKTTRL